MGNLKKSLVKIVTGIMLLLTLSTTVAQAIVTEYNNKSYSYIDEQNGIYEFYPYDYLGDWNYTCSSKEELNKLIESYNLCSSKEIEATCYLINAYSQLDGDVVLEYSDKSLIRINELKSEYELYLPITEDYTITFDNTEDLYNCFNTYKSIKVFGYY